MSQCDHTWVMDDSPRPACHKCFMERDACALADRIATLERELAAVTAERDAARIVVLAFAAWKERADHALSALDWWQKLAPTPPTGTPGDGTR